MGFIYVAQSKALAKWGADVGLGKNLYRVGYADSPEEVLKQPACGESDWTLVRKEAAEGFDDAAVIERLKLKEKMVDPNLYPRLKGMLGVFKVKPENAENHILVSKALAGVHDLQIKIKPADIAGYLIHNVLR
jgi:hypothetical protein